jgi:error-prone DNA polymerase
MPEAPYEKIKPSVYRTTTHTSSVQYAELQVTSNFSFLQSGSHPEELISQAANLGMRGIAITDHNSLAGVVRAHVAAKELGIQFRVGARLELVPTFPEDPFEVTPYRHNGTPLLVYPCSREGYGNLCRLLTLGKLRAAKGQCFITYDEFLQYQRDLIIIAVPPTLCADNRVLYQDKSSPAPLISSLPTSIAQRHGDFSRLVQKLTRDLSDLTALYIALTRSYTANNQQDLSVAIQIAKTFKVKTVVTNDVYYHLPERKILLDTITCIRHRCTIEQAGYLLQQNAERHLKDPHEMQRLFRDHPQSLHNTVEILDRTTGFSLDSLRYEYPNEITPSGVSSGEYLRHLTYQGATGRYPSGIPPKVQKLLEEEFKLIAELGYEKYFLTCYDIVQFARGRGILCQGRGAAANSAVCYCLGITAVDPTQIDLLFARFVSKERNEPPDIDIDFEHERREEVIQYIYQRFGRERAGLTCAVTTYRYRSAVRDVGKALGLSNALVDTIAKLIHRWTSCTIDADELRSIGIDPGDRTIQRVLDLSNQLLGFPRHLTQHVGGFIISEKALCETVPILNTSMDGRTMIEWDKDDIDALGMMKIDILALGMLTCIRKALNLINQSQRLLSKPHVELELHSIPAEDQTVYDMICKADTIGVFQIESRAQMSMLPRLKPRCFYDLVIEVAIVRPGPIQGNMVHPYLRRRNGIEKPYYPDERAAAVLQKTLGVPLFQEQAMRLAIMLANFTPGESEQLRRAMAAWKRDKGKITEFQSRIITGMRANGYTQEFAESCVQQIKGFSEYGFPESHAASFALLVYASAWIKRHYPAHFAAALLNSQPMGFYAPSQIISDARDHGVRVLPIDFQSSTWDCCIEERQLRLGLRLIKGLSEGQAIILSQLIKESGAISSLHQLWCLAQERRCGLKKATLEQLARADAFRSINLVSRDALWQIHALPPEVLPLDQYEKTESHSSLELQRRSAQEEMFADYSVTGLSLRGHPIGFIREHLTKLGVVSTAALRDRQAVKPGASVAVAGLAIVRQRPGTAKGVVFITIEDETGIANLIIRPDIFERFRSIVLMSSSIVAYGRIERVDAVVYVTAERIESLDSMALQPEGKVFRSRSYSY